MCSPLLKKLFFVLAVSFFINGFNALEAAQKIIVGGYQKIEKHDKPTETKSLMKKTEEHESLETKDSEGEFDLCEDLEEVTLEELAATFKSNVITLILKKLSKGRKLTETEREALKTHREKLTQLDLSECQDITDDVLSVFLEEKLPAMCSVNLSDCKVLTDKSFTLLFKQCSNLQVVIVSGCTQLTDASIKVLTESCPLLSYLDISSCQVADRDKVLTSLVKKRQTLTHLNIYGTSVQLINGGVPYRLQQITQSRKTLNIVSKSKGSFIQDTCTVS
jgi:hypothetical protein